jgi:hypothetical protein
MNFKVKDQSLKIKVKELLAFSFSLSAGKPKIFYA